MKGRGKGKVCVYFVKAIRGSRDVGSLIPNPTLEGGEGQFHAPAEKEPQCPLNRILGGSHSRLGCFEGGKSLTLPRFEPLVAQLVV